jgi:lysophospholipase L1-like esterase
MKNQIPCRTGFLLLAVGCFALITSPARADDFFFKEGDKVAMLGDSITEQHLYSNYVELWTVTRFPTWKLTFRNVGIGGDVSPGGNGRFKRDVLFHKPTALTVDFGMNDGGYGEFKEDRYKAYMTGLQGIADQAKEAKMRVAWITPQPIEQSEQQPFLKEKAYNLTLEKFSAGVKEIADKNQGLFIDQFHPYLATLEKARPGGVGETITYGHGIPGDGVHPGGPGQAVMAAAILKGMHLPSLVSAVEIDASTGKGFKSENCKVTDLSVKEDRVQFDRLDAALPFFPDEAKSIVKWSPIREELNDYRLKVTGLKDGRYSVLLGGKKIADYSADQLAKGVNLTEAALTAGPVADQVKAVVAAVNAKNKFHHDMIFRGVVLWNPPAWLHVKDLQEQKDKALAELEAKMPELDAAVWKALEMKAHRVEIVPAEK